MFRMFSPRRFIVCFTMSLSAVFLPISKGSQAADHAGIPSAGESIEVRTHLSPRRFTTLSTEMDGKIEMLAVREGDRVVAGQVLVKFNCGVEIAKAEKAEIIARQTSNVADAFARLFKLKAKSELEVAEAISNAAAAKAEASIMSQVLKRCTIAAPFPGRVFKLHVRRYQYVLTGKPLLGILDDRNLELELIVPSSWLTWLRLGTKFSILIEELNKPYRAKVSSIGARVDPVSQSIKVKARIVGAQTELMSGMGGRAIFQIPAR